MSIPSTRQRIIDTTLALIAERGPTQISMIEVARGAGIARQTLYNYFPDIPSIVTDAVIHHNAAAIDDLERALSVVETPSDTIKQLIRHIAAVSAHSGHSFDTRLALPDELQQHSASFDEAIEQHIHRAISAGIAAGDFRADLNIETDAVLIRHALGGVSTLVAAAPVDAPRIVADATRTLLAALTKESQS